MTTVAVAVSGGVDSLIAAHLLRESGHNVFGLHFLTGFDPTPVSSGDTHALQEIGRQLDMPVHIVDLAEDFKASVIAYFRSTYLAGRTPNPCLVCNPLIKFGRLLDVARDLGAHHLATGHYARIQSDPDERPRLFRGLDGSKDQSYFLARLTPDQLARAIFPLGTLRKEQVYALADKRGLSPITASESQDACFIRQKAYGEFLKHETALSDRPGPIENRAGEIVGQHRGLHHFTVGQRRGIGCPGADPYYVIALDPSTNRLIVGAEHDLYRSAFRVCEVNWIRRPAQFPVQASVQIRYRHRAAAARLEMTAAGEDIQVQFASPQKAVTPGQGAVFYMGDEVIGGGWIV
jgi:tRNA-specific 2-thiouridylase